MELSDRQLQDLTAMVDLIAAFRHLQEADTVKLGTLTTVETVIELIEEVNEHGSYPVWQEIADGALARRQAEMLTASEVIAQEAAQDAARSGLARSGLVLETMEIVTQILPDQPWKRRFAFMYLCTPVVTAVLGVTKEPASHT